MEEHDLLRRLQSEIEPDLVPVKPLGRPSSRALWLLATFVALLAGTLVVFGPRQDIGVLGFSRSFGFSALQFAVCFMLAAVGLRFAVPARSPSPSAALAWIVGAFSIHLLISWATVERSAISPASGHEWTTGVACLSAIALMGLAPLALGLSLLRRGLVSRPLPAFVLIGLSSALGAESAWRLHCAYSTWDHVLPFHSGAVVLLALISAAAAVAGSRGDRSPGPSDG